MDISIGTSDDINNVRSFIDSEWKKNHILARDENFFRYEYVYNNQLNFPMTKTFTESSLFIPLSIPFSQ